MPRSGRLLVYRFGPGGAFEGALVGALERLELEGGATVHDALFVAREEGSGELSAIDRSSAGMGERGVVTMLDFRLDPRRRRRITARTLAEHAGGVPPPVVRTIAEALEPGGALLCLLASAAAPVFDDAVARCGGRRIADEPVEADELAELGPLVRTAATA